MHLNKVQRQKEERGTERSIEKQRDKIRAGKASVAKKVERQQRIANSRFQDNEANDEKNSKDDLG